MNAKERTTFNKLTSMKLLTIMVEQCAAKYRETGKMAAKVADIIHLNWFPKDTFYVCITYKNININCKLLF